MATFNVGDRVRNVVSGPGTFSFLDLGGVEGTVVNILPDDNYPLIQVSWDNAANPFPDLGWNMLPDEIEKVDA